MKGKLCLCSVFHGIFSRPPTERATSGGKRAQTRTTGEKQCGALVTVLVRALHKLTDNTIPACVEFTVKRGRPARRPAIRLANDGFSVFQLAFSSSYMSLTCRTVTPPRLRRERGEKSSVFVRVRVLACRPSIWSTAACRVSHGRRHDEAARPSTSRCGTMPMALVSAAAQVQTLETRASACTVQVVPARESSFVLACQQTVSSCQRTVRYASFSACAPALRENRLPSQKPPRPYSSKPSPPHWSASVIAFC